ncbi:MAG TPA: M56 family metallopeptidase [Chitinophagaceae bacterium]|nr:M56 family metallopeptidase [Chitinophagaceae bacterium]
MTEIGRSAFLQALGWAVVNSLWQMALLWIVYNLVLGSTRRNSSSRRSAIALALLLAGFGWFLLTLAMQLAGGHTPGGPVHLGSLSEAVNARVNGWLVQFLPYASLTYLILFIIPAWQFVRNYRFAQALRRCQLRKMDADHRLFVSRIAARLGIRRRVQIWLSGLATSPVTIGFLRPVILVPMAAMAQLTPQQLEAVILHELAHIRRHDYLLNLLVQLARSILYFNPFVALFARTVEKEREKSCDELVMQFQYDPHGYAHALLTLERYHQLPQRMAIAASGRNDLLHRVERILGIEKTRLLGLERLAGLFAGLLCFLLLNSLLIAGKPASRSGSLTYEQLTLPLSFFSQDDPGSASATPTGAQIAVGQSTRPGERLAVGSGQKVFTAAGQPQEGKQARYTNPEHPATVSAETAPIKLSGTPLQITQADFHAVLAPHLNPVEVRQVEKAVQATRKVLQESNRKALENSIADVLTTREKQQVLDKYQLELRKINWSQLEQKLKTSYDQINWDKVNGRLDAALVRLQLDSLEQVYSKAYLQLEQAQSLLSAQQDSLQAHQPVSLPIPDVSIDQLQRRLAELRSGLETIRLMREHKIIHL